MAARVAVRTGHPGSSRVAQVVNRVGRVRTAAVSRPGRLAQQHHCQPSDRGSCTVRTPGPRLIYFCRGTIYSSITEGSVLGSRIAAWRARETGDWRRRPRARSRRSGRSPLPAQSGAPQHRQSGGDWHGPWPRANGRLIDTGGHRVFAVILGAQVVKTSGRDVLTWLHDHEASRPELITTRPATQATTASP